MVGRILAFEDKMRGGLEAYVLNFVRAEHGETVAKDAGAFVHNPATSSQAVRALVNGGRWIVRCSSCSGAQFASRSDRRFFCSSCLNHANNNRWIGVEWPDDASIQRIERALMLRPNPANRNWEPGESVADLDRENGLHGHLKEQA